MWGPLGAAEAAAAVAEVAPAAAETDSVRSRGASSLLGGDCRTIGTDGRKNITLATSCESTTTQSIRFSRPGRAEGIGSCALGAAFDLSLSSSFRNLSSLSAF